MNIVTFVNSIHAGNLRPVYLILGHQSYLIRLLEQTLLKLIPANQRTMNYARYDLATTRLDTVLNDAASAPFFGQHRLVIVDNANFLTGKSSVSVGKKRYQHDLKSLTSYLKRPLSSTILVFLVSSTKLDRRKKIVKLMQRRASVVNLAYLSDDQIRNYVYNQIQAKGYQIDRSALELLIQRTGNQLSVMMNELPKLFLDCRSNRVISVRAVNSLVTKSLDQNVFDLVRDVLSHRITQSIILYHKLLLSGQPPLKINAILTNQFRLLLQVMILNRKGYSQGGLAKLLQVNPYRIKLALRSIYQLKFNLSTLARAYLSLVAIEIQLKSTSRSPEFLFNDFALKFGNQKSSRIS